MQITLLGTGTSQGVPVIGCNCKVCTSKSTFDNRTRCSIFIQSGNTNLIIDTGPDFRNQCLKNKVTKIDAILYTHEHRDHVAGLDDIRPLSFKMQNDLDVYCTPHVAKNLKQTFSYMFAQNRYPGVATVNINLLQNLNSFTIGDILIEPIQVMHHKLPVLGFKISDFVYITDANFIDNEEIAKIKNCNVLVLNALHKEKHISHFNLTEAMEMATKINAKQTYFTHISHHMGLHTEVNQTLPKNMQLGFDNQIITL